MVFLKQSAKEKEMGTFDGMLSAPNSPSLNHSWKNDGTDHKRINPMCICTSICSPTLWSDSTRKPATDSFFVILGIFSFIGIGIMAVSLARNQRTAAMIMNLLMFPFMFLSGILFPIPQMPWIMQEISKVIPLTYAADAMRKIMLLNANVADVSTDIIILLAFGIITLPIALPLFSKSMKQ